MVAYLLWYFSGQGLILAVESLHNFPNTEFIFNVSAIRIELNLYKFRSSIG